MATEGNANCLRRVGDSLDGRHVDLVPSNKPFL